MAPHMDHFCGSFHATLVLCFLHVRIFLKSKDLLNVCMPMNDVQHHFSLYGYGRLPCSMFFMFCFSLGGKADVSFAYLHKIWQIHQGGNKRWESILFDVPFVMMCCLVKCSKYDEYYFGKFVV